MGFQSIQSDYHGGELPVTSPNGELDYIRGDVILSKLSPDGSTLIYSTFIGGSNYEDVNNVFIDDFDNIYIGGWTKSSDFPITESNLDPEINTEHDEAFIVKMKKDGIIDFISFLGGKQNDYIKN